MEPVASTASSARPSSTAAAPEDPGSEQTNADSTPADDSASVPQSPDPSQALGPTAQPVLPTVGGTLDDDIELSTGMIVSLTSITTTRVEAETPGDIAGDAVEVIVQLTNVSPEIQNADSAVVSLETSDGELGIPTLAGGADPLTGEIAPKQSSEGRYLFVLDPVHGRTIVISVNYGAGEPVAQFTGITP